PASCSSLTSFPNQVPCALIVWTRYLLSTPCHLHTAHTHAHVCVSRTPARSSMPFGYTGDSPLHAYMHNSPSRTGRELGGEGKGVVHAWVGQVVVQVLNGALAGHNGLHEEPEHGEHGKAAVLDLLDLELRKRVWVVSKAQWVKRLSRVQWVQALAGWAAIHTVALHQAHQDDLARQRGDDVLRMHQRRVAQVVQATLLEDLGAGLEPHGLTELHAALGQQLRGHAAQSTQHSPTRVDQLQLAIALEGLRVRRQASSVPAVVTRKLAGQVGRGGIVAVRAKPLGAVRAIPLEARALRGSS
ncbi:hypothetical protein Vretifemale_16240, partial [Volvox reticuliferus]